jgi:GR25 family glycosyltransferase involved in LPS biosynthesis
MSDWQKYFDKVFVISLKKRQDRRDRMIEIFEEYDIEGEIFEAIDIPKSFLGLVETTKNLFKSCLDAGFKNCLVFEDDCEFLVKPELFHETMEKCVEDLKTVNYDIFYLGLQHPRPFLNWRTRNLLHVNMGYSTHALAYSAKAMKFFLDFNVCEPIDNFWCRCFQHYNTCYASYPLLATQKDGFSDINHDYLCWDKYIQPSYEKAVKGILSIRP